MTTHKCGFQLIPNGPVRRTAYHSLRTRRVHWRVPRLQACRDQALGIRGSGED